MKVTNDRRKKPRVGLGGVAVLYDGRSSYECEGLDLSASGIGLRSIAMVKKGRKVKVVLTVGPRSMTLPAVVRRCAPHGSAFRLGLKFGRLDKVRAKILDDLVADALTRISPGFQARVFLSRAAEASADMDGFETTSPAPAPARLEPASTPIDDEIVDEDAPTGPTQFEGARPRARTAAWSPTPPRELDHIQSESLRSVIESALDDVSAEVGLHGSATPNGTIIADRRILAARSLATPAPAPAPTAPSPFAATAPGRAPRGTVEYDEGRPTRLFDDGRREPPAPSTASGPPSPFGAHPSSYPTSPHHPQPTRPESGQAPSAVHTQGGVAGASGPAKGGTQVAIRSPFSHEAAPAGGGRRIAAPSGRMPSHPPSPFESHPPPGDPVADPPPAEDDRTLMRSPTPAPEADAADDFASQYARALADLDLENR